MSDTDYIVHDIEGVYVSVDENITIVHPPVIGSEEPVVEPTVEEVIKEIEEPVVEEVIEEPIVEEVIEEPIVEPVVEEVIKEIVEPVVEEVIEEPIVEEVIKEIVEPVVEEVIKEIVEPVVEPVAEPLVEEVIKEIVEPIVEEVIKEIVEPVVEEVIKEIVEPVVEEVIVEPIAEPVIKEEVISSVPKVIFIVPYRDREEQRKFFDLHMEKILEEYEYRILYIHQTDQRSFNRGAMKNIGFMYVKSLYPNDYQNMTLVFNDVDTMPYTKDLLKYDTTMGNVKHFYGYKFTLGGIVSIKGADFEKTNGFPNFWAWGYEDNAFQRRVLQAGLTIDRSIFYPIMDKNILQLKDGITRIVNRGEFDKYVDEVKFNNMQDGIRSLYSVSFQYNEDTSFLNVLTFQTPIPEKPELTKTHDMRDGAIPFKQTPQQRRGRALMKMAF